MKNSLRHIATILAAAACLAPLTALATEPMAATIKVSGGGVYDYVVIGESPKATDGFDNAYDTLAPGDSLNTTYISSYFSHPEWGAAKPNFRGDIRALAEKQVWTLNITSTLPAGTPLTVELQSGMNVLPKELKLSVKDSGNTAAANLLGDHLSLTSPAPGTTTQLIITAEQSAGTPSSPLIPPVTSGPDGDVDGDGQTTITDAIKVLRMALHLTPTTDTVLQHGDMNGDGKLTLLDAMKLIRKAVGIN